MDKRTITKEEILAVLGQMKEILHERFYVKNIGIFGSYARNEANSESDIDFLVDFEEGDLDYYTIRRDLHDFLGLKFDRKIDIAIRKSLKPFFRETILKQAVYA